MDPEDGPLWVHGIGEDAVPAFTDLVLNASKKSSPTKGPLAGAIADPITEIVAAALFAGYRVSNDTPTTCWANLFPRGTEPQRRESYRSDMTTDTIARLKITLDDVEPAVLRRIEVPS